MNYGYRTLVVNLFGAPATGKTTLAHRLVAALAMRGYLTEYVAEYAKELIYAEQRVLLDGMVKNQRIVTGEQMHRIERLLGKVEIIVTDSPSLLGIFYADSKQSDYQGFSEELRDWHQAQNALDVFVGSAGLAFDQRGRKHTERESARVQNAILDKVPCSLCFTRKDDGSDDFDDLLSAIISKAEEMRTSQISA